MARQVGHRRVLQAGGVAPGVLDASAVQLQRVLLNAQAVVVTVVGLYLVGEDQRRAPGHGLAVPGPAPILADGQSEARRPAHGYRLAENQADGDLLAPAVGVAALRAVEDGAFGNGRRLVHDHGGSDRVGRGRLRAPARTLPIGVGRGGAQVFAGVVIGRGVGGIRGSRDGVPRTAVGGTPPGPGEAGYPAVRVAQGGRHRAARLGRVGVQGDASRLVHVEDGDGHHNGVVNAGVRLAASILAVVDRDRHRVLRLTFVVQGCPGGNRNPAGVVDGKVLAARQGVGQGIVVVAVGGGYQVARAGSGGAVLRHAALGGVSGELRLAVGRGRRLDRRRRGGRFRLRRGGRFRLRRGCGCWFRLRRRCRRGRGGRFRLWRGCRRGRGCRFRLWRRCRWRRGGRFRLRLRLGFLRGAVHLVSRLVGYFAVAQPDPVAVGVLNGPAVGVDGVLLDADAVVVAVGGLDLVGEDEPGAVLVGAVVPGPPPLLADGEPQARLPGHGYRLAEGHGNDDFLALAVGVAALGAGGDGRACGDFSLGTVVLGLGGVSRRQPQQGGGQNQGDCAEDAQQVDRAAARHQPPH